MPVTERCFVVRLVGEDIGLAPDFGSIIEFGAFAIDEVVLCASGFRESIEQDSWSHFELFQEEERRACKYCCF